MGPFRVLGQGPWVCPILGHGPQSLPKMKSNRSHSGKTPGGVMALTPPYHKQGSYRPSPQHPHPLRTMDHPWGPDQERDWRLKKYSIRSKKASYPMGFRGQPSCFLPLQSRTSTSGPGAPAGKGCPMLNDWSWSQTGEIDCHVMLWKAKAGDSTPKGAVLTHTLTHPPRGGPLTAPLLPTSRDRGK